MNLKLFKYTCGVDERIGVFADADEAYERRAEVDPTFHFLPVRIDEIIVPGYVITIEPELGAAVSADRLPTEEEIATLDRAGLRAFLEKHKVEYVKQWGDDRLRETALTWVGAQNKGDAE
ncbi:hypothetical protein [Cohnella sp. GbtcB17]|uniref:hypothetical protein n=1 Tax=Cohnella sp. GbtcB17 TaxID=2824762 RepID=UPI001C2F3907|nr:hypothetical protein [Cohnella sp. GbtcB17]